MREYPAGLSLLLSERDKQRPRIKTLGDLIIWNTRFKFQSRDTPTNSIRVVPTAARLKELESPDGDVDLIGSGTYRSKTTETKAGTWMNEGEAILFPMGGNAFNVKYVNGRYCTANCYGGISSDENIVLTEYLSFLLEEMAPAIDRMFNGCTVRQPDMMRIMSLKVEIPRIQYQRRVCETLNGFKSMLNQAASNQNLAKERLMSHIDSIFSNIIPVDGGAQP